MSERLRLSVLDLSPVFEPADAYNALQQSVQLAQLAESHGYERYWISEHHDMENLASTSPEIMIAHIGAVTEKIRLGSGAVLLPYYSPLKVAETFHTLSVLYPGRIDLGVGRAPGGNAYASMALGGNFLERVHQMPQRVDDLCKLLSFQYTYEQQPVIARPVPAHSPELWMLGTNVKSAEFASAQGTGFVFGHFMSDQDGAHICNSYRTSFQKGHLRQEPYVIVAVQVICAETEEAADKLAALQHETLSRNNGDNPNGVRNILTGTPARIKEQLFNLKRQYDTDEFMVLCMIPDYEKRRRAYQQLAEECIIV